MENEQYNREQFVKYAKLYFKHFGEHYPIKCRDISHEYAIKEIKKCIETNKKYDPGLPEDATI